LEEIWMNPFKIFGPATGVGKTHQKSSQIMPGLSKQQKHLKQRARQQKALKAAELAAALEAIVDGASQEEMQTEKSAAQVDTEPADSQSPRCAKRRAECDADQSEAEEEDVDEDEPERRKEDQFVVLEVFGDTSDEEDEPIAARSAAASRAPPKDVFAELASNSDLKPTERFANGRKLHTGDHARTLRRKIKKQKQAHQDAATTRPLADFFPRVDATAAQAAPRRLTIAQAVAKRRRGRQAQGSDPVS